MNQHPNQVVFFKGKNGRFHWRAKVNGEVIAKSCTKRGYARKIDAKNSLRRMVKRFASDNWYEVDTTRPGFEKGK